MTELLHKIQQLTDVELLQVMQAIERRYAQAYPAWDVVYLAVHKDPELRRKELEEIFRMMEMDLIWQREVGKGNCKP